MKTPPLSVRHRSHGMVLLEVIVALTIFALISLGLVVALDKAFSAERDRNAADAAVLGLRNQFALLRGATVTPGAQDLPEDGNGLGYHIEIVPLPMESDKKQPIIGMYRATVTAHWTHDGGVEKREISEDFFQP